MSLRKIFNKIHATQGMEELEQAARRLNTLIQVQAIRTGHGQYFDYEQAMRRIPMNRNASYELDKKIVEKTNEIMKKLRMRSPDLRNPSMQEIIHLELMALDKYKARLQEKRIRRRRGRKVLSKTTRSSIGLRRPMISSPFTVLASPVSGKSEEIEEKFEREIKSQMINAASQKFEDMGKPMMFEGKCINDFHMNDLPSALNRIECMRDIHSKLEHDKPAALEPKALKRNYSLDHMNEVDQTEAPVETTEHSFKSHSTVEVAAEAAVRKPIRTPTAEAEKDHEQFLQESIREVRDYTETNPLIDNVKSCSTMLLNESLSDAGDIKLKALTTIANSEMALTKYSGMTIKEAMHFIKQNSTDDEIVLFISPLPGESLRESPVFQVTLFNRWEKRILGSFQIPDKKLRNLDEEGIFKMYPVIFLSTCIMTVQNSIDMILDHFFRITRVHPNHDDINRLFELAESYQYRIYSRLDYGNDEPIYVCDFYTSKNDYIGTTRLYGADVLGQLKSRPKILKNFEIIVELNDRIIPKKIKDVIDTLLSRLTLTKIYEQVGMVLLQIYRKFV